MFGIFTNFSNFIKKIFGTANDRILKKFSPYVDQINALEAQMANLSDEELRARTFMMQEKIHQGESLDNLIVDAFATIREAAKRVLGHRHFDVQLLGGVVLHKGMFAEMRTGEGKTLVVTLPVYLNALAGKGVHVVTVNDYLAQRDSEWMGQIYSFLGLSVGCIINSLNDHERRVAYQADITYGTNNEFGFDYLRDNMKFRKIDMVQRPFFYAIVDEADSILIDEARTPLIISGPAEDSSQLYHQVDELMYFLENEDYEKDEKQRNITLTEKGSEKIEQLLSQKDILKTGTLYDAQNISLVHHVNQALNAHKLFHRNVDYIVRDDKVILIDEFTGRMMDGRRYSDGLHQALEAKEKVTIQMENQTLASITFQNYFRLYPKLAGMSGTAMTEATELMDIYKLEVVALPTNVPCIRKDDEDQIYRTAREKYKAIIKLIEQCRERQQPVLVGTVSIEKSEIISDILKQHGITHQILNARHHEKEATIIAQAGSPGSITIATNMAGRGTDIKLGGNFEFLLEEALTGVEDPGERKKITEEIYKKTQDQKEIVLQAGGLCVIGTERHESRRIDNQLRGRSGRQGDPGYSCFFLCLEDDLMRIFGSDRLDSMLVRLGLEEDEVITHKMVTRALEKAQMRVEARNYDIRKQLLKYDDVMNDQRRVIYEQRRELMEETLNISEEIEEMRYRIIESIVSRCILPETYAEMWNKEGLHEEALRLLNLDLPLATWFEEETITPQHIKERITDLSNRHMVEKFKEYTEEEKNHLYRNMILRILDQAWKEHLLGLDHLRQGINLRAYGQRDPLTEYKHEAFLLFEVLLTKIDTMVIAALSHLEGNNIDFGDEDFEEADHLENRPLLYSSFAGTLSRAEELQKNEYSRLPRNSLCPCGSGKKVKHCHGRS
jgi:preprotein translocase subunit SecA